MRVETMEREHKVTGDPSSHEDLDKLFGNTLVEVADLSGVSPEKLKRKCRDHSIEWRKPPRKRFSRSIRREPSSSNLLRARKLSNVDLKLQFGKKLGDGAKQLGVSRSTFKRACRVQGIKEWPRKRDKVNCSSSKNQEGEVDSSCKLNVELQAFAQTLRRIIIFNRNQNMLIHHDTLLDRQQASCYYDLKAEGSLYM